MTAVSDVLEGRSLWGVWQGDCLEWLATLPDCAASLVIFSPPYEAARTYGIGFKLRGQDWVDWMVKVFREALRVCCGLVVCVCEGQTRGFRWSATPVLLMADLHRAGIHLRKPPIYQRIGIPGSGGPDWLRNDYELCICATNGGKLPWSDNTACGHPPRWGPGGAMSNRLTNGQRVNQWGSTGGPRGGGNRQANGTFDKRDRPSHKTTVTRRRTGVAGDAREHQDYAAPVLANPGNVINCGSAGGGHMGNKLASKNEAPYPEKLVDVFVRSFCPPGGIVCDPFSGSGTTGAVSLKSGRRFIGCDVRASQVELSRRRIRGETPPLFPDGMRGAVEVEEE